LHLAILATFFNGLLSEAAEANTAQQSHTAAQQIIQRVPKQTLWLQSVASP
jgi:hypothetical protein